MKPYFQLLFTSVCFACSISFTVLFAIKIYDAYANPVHTLINFLLRYTGPYIWAGTLFLIINWMIIYVKHLPKNNRND